MADNQNTAETVESLYPVLHKFVPAARVQACTKLAREFQAYVARTHGLRATFLSIKGTYYQAELFGVSVTWIVPHSFAQQPTMEARPRAIRAQFGKIRARNSGRNPCWPPQIRTAAAQF